MDSSLKDTCQEKEYFIQNKMSSPTKLFSLRDRLSRIVSRDDFKDSQTSSQEQEEVFQHINKHEVV